MISILNDPSARLIKSYLPPFKGTWKTLASHLLPDDVLQDSMNVTLLEGKLRSRLGLKLFDFTTFPSYITGSFMFIDINNNKIPVIALRNKVYKYSAGFTDITGALFLSTATQSRFTSIQLGTSIYLIMANGIDSIKVAQDLTLLQDISPYVDPSSGVASSIPVLTDIITSFNRIVGIKPPYTLTWSAAINNDYLNFTNWPSSNQVILSDTEDALVAIAPLGTLGFAVYKEGNIFVGFAQSGPDSSAFRLEHRGSYEGPAGVQALVKAQGGHFYMTTTGRIAYFDGTQHQWVADGLWPFLQSDIDFTYSKNIFGVYNYQTSEIYFWYPKVGDSGLIKGMVILNLPYPLAGVTSFSYFLGESNFSCTNGLSSALFNSTVDPFVFGLPNSNPTAFTLNKDTYTDNSQIFNCSLTTGLFKPTIEAQNIAQFQADIYRPILEIYVSRDSTRGTLNVTGLTSNTLETNGLLTDERETLDLTKRVINEYIGFNSSGSFLGAKLEWLSSSKVEYKGIDVYGRVNM